MTQEKEILGYSRGLFLLANTDMWERFSYYGMRALLVLYLVAATSNNGMGWTTTAALNLYGTFTMLIYILPLFGTWLADNVLGQRKAITYGGFLLSFGYFTLAIPSDVIQGLETQFLYAGLLLIVIGNMLFKTNMSGLVSGLFKDDESRRVGGFTIFYMCINLGAFISPLIIGGIGEKVNWHYGFAIAGFGMLIGLITQLIYSKRYLGDLGIDPSAKVAKKKRVDENVKALTQDEKDRTKVILLMSVFSIVFWVGFAQAGGLFTIYASEFTDRSFIGFEVPATWFQALNGLFLILFAPYVASLWCKLGDKEPKAPVKFSIAMVLLSLGFLVMVLATFLQGGDESIKVSMLFLVFTYLFHTLAELCLSPIGLSSISKLAPVKLTSLLIAVWVFCSALANKLAAVVGTTMGRGEQQIENALIIFSSIALAGLVTALIVYLLSNTLVKWMHVTENEQDSDEEKRLEQEVSVVATHEGM
jgi:POT family proton-dependent oligopeptide transporter